MKRRWSLLPILPSALALFWWGPDLRVRLRERGEVDNLRRLGGAVALYMGDHEGQYPLVTSVEATRVELRDGIPVLATNPLAPYVAERGWLVSTGTRTPYALRFAIPIRIRNPRDPSVALERRLRFTPDPLHVMAAAKYQDGWQRGWTTERLTMVEGWQRRGHAYLLRGDGHVERTSLDRARFVAYDGTSGRWSAVSDDPPKEDFGKPWSNPIWSIFPGEAWPPKVTAFDGIP